MNRLSILMLSVLLSGCKTATVEHLHFPATPPALQEDCGNLQTLANDAKLSDLMITITMNYMKFHDCKRKNQGWQQWYDEQKTIFENATRK